VCGQNRIICAVYARGELECDVSLGVAVRDDGGVGFWCAGWTG